MNRIANFGSKKKKLLIIIKDTFALDTIRSAVSKEWECVVEDTATGALTHFYKTCMGIDAAIIDWCVVGQVHGKSIINKSINQFIPIVIYTWKKDLEKEMPGIVVIHKGSSLVELQEGLRKAVKKEMEALKKLGASNV